MLLQMNQGLNICQKSSGNRIRCDERRVSAGKSLNTGTIWGQMNDRSRAISESQLSRLATRIGAVKV
jgi:hypothetical protein